MEVSGGWAPAGGVLSARPGAGVGLVFWGPSKDRGMEEWVREGDNVRKAAEWSSQGSPENRAQRVKRLDVDID